MKKNESFTPVKFLTNFENPSSYPLQRPQSGNPFSLQPMTVGTREHQPITEKGILRRVSESIFKIVSYFKDASDTVPLIKLYD
jgi:hypothetical protein